MGNDEELNLSDILDLGTEERDVHRRVAEFCRVDLRDLDQALERHPSLFAYASACFEMAKVREARAKWEMEVVKAQVFQILCDQNPKLTATAAEKLVNTTPAVAVAMKTYHDELAVVARLKGLTNGLEHRRDMLVQLSSRQKAEMRNT